MYRLKNTINILLVIGTMALTGACNKNLDSRLPSVPNGLRDSATNIRTWLQGSSCTLFNKAFVRAGLDSSYGYYTIFAPSDSAMTAAGLTAAAIDALTIDSLNKIVGYHIVKGVYADSTLENDSLTAVLPTLRQDILWYQANAFSSPAQSVYQQNLYVWKKGGLYINTAPVSQTMPTVRATNGYVFPINRVLIPPVQSVWNIILSRPELSLYVAANELVDSFYSANYFGSVTVDTTIFSTVYYANSNPNTYPTPVLTQSTVFAPTNTAFNKAGFNTVDDIRQYVLQSIPHYVSVPYPPYSQFNYNAMDSVLKGHYLFMPAKYAVFYQDLLSFPGVNNGSLNTNSWYVQAYQANTPVTPFYPLFSGQNGTLSIQWSRDPSVTPALLPFSAAGSFFATNGVIYEIDQLFFPHN